MNIKHRIPAARRPGRFCWLASTLWLAALICCSTYLSAGLSAGEPLFDAPRLTLSTASDEVFLISTRSIGLSCKPASISQGLRCQRRVVSSQGRVRWETANWRRLLSPTTSMPTIVYVHGNRITSGVDRKQGMQIYRSLKPYLRQSGPVRFVIWSWPSNRIPGLFKDFHVKAQRTNAVAWQLAWFLDKLPVETPISLVGYSYGTRVVSGATHLLADGQLGGLKLSDRKHPQRPPHSLALLAAAYNADWIQPGNFYGKSMQQTKRLVLATNNLDPAMRFFHFSNGRSRIHALGKSGVHRPQALGRAASRLQPVDYKHEVGRNHSLDKYLAASRKMSLFWQKLFLPPAAPPTAPPDEFARMH